MKVYETEQIFTDTLLDNDKIEIKFFETERIFINFFG